MIGFALIAIVLGFIVALLIYAAQKTNEEAYSSLGILLCFVILIVSVIAFFLGTAELSNTKQFIINKTYYEKYGVLPDNQYRSENYTIDNENLWLIQAQSSRDMYGIFSLYPPRVTKLTGIE